MTLADDRCRPTGEHLPVQVISSFSDFFMACLHPPRLRWSDAELSGVLFAEVDALTVPIRDSDRCARAANCVCHNDQRSVLGQVASACCEIDPLKSAEIKCDLGNPNVDSERNLYALDL
jgi:hypothetical protein